MKPNTIVMGFLDDTFHNDDFLSPYSEFATDQFEVRISLFIVWRKTLPSFLLLTIRACFHLFVPSWMQASGSRRRSSSGLSATS